MSALPILAAEDNLLSHVLPHRIFAEPLVPLGAFSIYFTNHALMTLVAAVVMLAVFLYVGSRVRTRGTGVAAYTTQGRLAQFFEFLCVFIREEVARPALGHLTDRYIKFIWTLFFFILFCNLLGMVPVGAILRLATGDRHLEHIGGTATGNLWITAGLAILVFVTTHAVGIKESGLAYFKHFNPGPAYLAPLLVPLELLGAVIKPFSLTVRLFANMIAGHLVLAAFIGLIFVFKNYGVAAGSLLGATALSLLELFVAFLQAYIFTFLAVLFISSGAIHEHEHGEHEDEDAGEEYGHAEPAGLEHAVVREPGHAPGMVPSPRTAVAAQRHEHAHTPPKHAPGGH